MEIVFDESLFDLGLEEYRVLNRNFEIYVRKLRKRCRMPTITETAFQLMIKAAECNVCPDCNENWDITTRYLKVGGDWRKIAINQINTCETCQARFKDEIKESGKYPLTTRK